MKQAREWAVSCDEIHGKGNWDEVTAYSSEMAAAKAVENNISDMDDLFMYRTHALEPFIVQVKKSESSKKIEIFEVYPEVDLSWYAQRKKEDRNEANI